MLIGGGCALGLLGDRVGRIKVLFGSIILYSLANIANGLVNGVEASTRFCRALRRPRSRGRTRRLRHARFRGAAADPARLRHRHDLRRRHPRRGRGGLRSDYTDRLAAHRLWLASAAALASYCSSCGMVVAECRACSATMNATNKPPFGSQLRLLFTPARLSERYLSSGLHLARDFRVVLHRAARLPQPGIRQGSQRHRPGRRAFRRGPQLHRALPWQPDRGRPGAKLPALAQERASRRPGLPASCSPTSSSRSIPARR